MSSIVKIILFVAFLIAKIPSNQSDFAEGHSEKKCLSDQVIRRFQLNRNLFQPCETLSRKPRRVERIFKGNPKPRSEVLASKFHLNVNNDQAISLVGLVNKVAVEYLGKCPPVIYYDSYVRQHESYLLENLFKSFPITFAHSEINSRYTARNSHLRNPFDETCRSYILFLSDPLMTRSIIGPQVDSRVVVVSRSTQWKLRDFLASEKSSNIVNLLVIGESLSGDPTMERPHVLYTHKLYSDGLGSNAPIVLTTWIKGALTRPHVDLFPRKFSKGFAGHRFQVVAADQPPFIFRIKSLDFSGGTQVHWDGGEYRLLNIFGKKLNFSIDIVDIADKKKSNVESLQMAVSLGMADIGMSGIYIAGGLPDDVEMSIGHSKDCAAFITLASKALPKYRAIMGPFQWPVWVALICVYLGGIFPIVFTDRLTLSHLIGNWGEIENMFWYVFGMFTNSLTFSGKYSWGTTQKVSTRLLIGSYWIFTIIITACYTGSIIAFVTLPAFPDTVDSVLDLLGLFFRVGTLDNGGWESWFQNSSHSATSRLLQKMEYVSTLEEGIGNVTQSFFWNYAFLGSKAQLEYLVQSNFTNENLSKRSALHLSDECFAMFYIGYLFPKQAVYKQKLNSLILLAQQAGIVNKIENEVKWAMQRSAMGKLLQASSSAPLKEAIQEERQLTTADTEGMFLLMGIGYTIGAIALISEIVGGITNKCRQIIRRSRKSISSAWSSSRNSTAFVNEEAEIAHALRKLARKTENESNTQSYQGFGWKQFNLTRTTLKELYGDYHQPQPDYVYKDGKVCVEEPIDSDISGESVDTEGYVNEKCERNSLDDIEKVVDRILGQEIENTLRTFDRTLSAYSDHGQESYEDVVVRNNSLNQTDEEIFGSLVYSHPMDGRIDVLDNLQLFNSHQEEKSDK